MSSVVDKLIPPFLDCLISAKLVEKNNDGTLDWSWELADHDHFICQVIRLKVKSPKDGKGDARFIIKIPENGLLYQSYRYTGAYETEIFMYRKMLPRLNQLLSTSGESYFVPRFHGTNGGLGIVLEDLGEKGYKKVPKTGIMGIRSLTKTVEKLAQFHGATIKLKETDPDLFERFTRIMFPATSLIPREQFPTRVEKVLRLYLPNYEQKYLADFKKFAPLYLDQIMEDLDADRSRFNVLSHGHFNMDNVLVKRNADDSVDDVKFTGFMYHNWVNPVVDLIYLFMTATTLDVYKEHGATLLAHYHDHLGKTLEKLKCDRKLPFTVQDIRKSFEKKTAYALFVVTLVLPFTRTDQPEQSTQLSDDYLFKAEMYSKLAPPWVKYLVEERKALLRNAPV